jgi:tetratricopeptide (TPR) repeat protein
MDVKSIARLKEQARSHEQHEEWEMAITIYLQVLRGDGDEEEGGVGDLPLYNRVGDLYLRTGRPHDAVRFYEKAADHYAEADLYNNAIALCNKALRYAPTRLDLLRKLGRLSASQGFLTDARRWFLEFAERSFNKGDVDDAFKALDDFADISDDAGIREMLARKLYAHGRFDDAQSEYRRAWAMHVRDGATGDADSLKAEILERYPDLTDLELEEEVAAPHGHDGHDDRLPQLGDYGSDGHQPRAPAGLPGLDDREPVSPDGFETTSLAPAEAGTDPDEPETEVAGPDDTANEPVAEPPQDLEPTAIGEPAPEPLPGYDSHVPAGATATNADAATDGAASDDYVDLSDFLGVNDKEPEETRFFVQETDPTGDEDRDFAELLAQFKKKIAENVAHDDIGSHYDLGLAFKEMGLFDEAIGEFQIALRAGDDRLKIFEELGQCFLLKRQFNIAVKVLARAMQFEPDDEIELIGVYYHLGRAYEELSQRDQAMDAYERVVGLDINFKDVADRMARL